MKTKKVTMSELKPGMKIKSLGTDGTIVFKEILDVFSTQVKHQDQVLLTFDNGTQISCSVNHPIMVFSEGDFKEILPANLSINDKVLTEHGFTRILTVDFGQKNDPGYIDITVEGTHTFFTASNPNSEMILTHNSQGGIRNASATVNFPIWHYQFDDLIVLKNNQGTDENRVRHLDYCVVMCKFFWRRFAEQGVITFFDPNEVPDLYEAFYADSKKFEKLYTEYEKNPNVRKKSEPAETVIKDWLLKERGDTGRYYILNIDNVSDQGPFDTNIHPIYQTNLCVAPDTIVSCEIDNLNVDIRIDELTELFNSGKNIKILSKNTETNVISYQSVLAAAKTDVDRKLLKITDSSTGKFIKVTHNHKVWTKNRGWVEAQHLKADDELDII